MSTVIDLSVFDNSSTLSDLALFAAAAKAVVDKFTAEGYNPEGYTLYTYAAIQAFAAAANKAKSLKVDDLSKTLKSMTVDTVIGSLSWDAKGDVTDPKYVFYIWKDGKYSQI